MHINDSLAGGIIGELAAFFTLAFAKRYGAEAIKERAESFNDLG